MRPARGCLTGERSTRDPLVLVLRRWCALRVTVCHALGEGTCCNLCSRDVAQKKTVTTRHTLSDNCARHTLALFPSIFPTVTHNNRSTAKRALCHVSVCSLCAAAYQTKWFSAPPSVACEFLVRSLVRKSSRSLPLTGVLSLRGLLLREHWHGQFIAS